MQQGSATEVEMKTALHRGTMQDFNVYSAAPVGTGGEDIAGFTKLPMFSKVRKVLHVETESCSWHIWHQSVSKDGCCWTSRQWHCS